MAKHLWKVENIRPETRKELETIKNIASTLVSEKEAKNYAMWFLERQRQSGYWTMNYFGPYPNPCLKTWRIAREKNLAGWTKFIHVRSIFRKLIHGEAWRKYDCSLAYDRLMLSDKRMKTEMMESIPENTNPFWYDMYNMGTRIAKNVYIMHPTQPDQRVHSFYIYNVETGEKMRIIMNNDPHAFGTNYVEEEETEVAGDKETGLSEDFESAFDKQLDIEIANMDPDRVGEFFSGEGEVEEEIMKPPYTRIGMDEDFDNEAGNARVEAGEE